MRECSQFLKGGMDRSLATGHLRADAYANYFFKQNLLNVLFSEESRFEHFINIKVGLSCTLMACSTASPNALFPKQRRHH